MAKIETPKDDNIDVAGVKLSSTAAGYAATGGHLVGGVAPGALGTGAEIIADKLDESLIQKMIVRDSWPDEIVKALNDTDIQLTDEATGRLRPLTRQDLDTPQGMALVLEHQYLLPEAIQTELKDASDYASKLAKFGAQLGEQAALTVLTGGIAAFAITIGTGNFADKLHNEMLGIHENVTVSMVAPTVKQQLIQQEKDPNFKADRSLIGAYIIASRPELFSEYNDEDLVRKVSEHIAAKNENPHAATELDLTIEGMDLGSEAYAGGAFSSLVPADTDLSKFDSSSYLDIISQHMTSKNMGDILFNPGIFKHDIKLSSMGEMVQAATQSKAPTKEEAVRLGRKLHQQMQGVSGKPVAIPTQSDKGPGLSA